MRKYMTLGGDYSGQPFEPLPWFEDMVRSVYGNLDPEGLRWVTDVYMEAPKGSGKTLYIAALVLTELCLAPNRGTEIYSAATVKKQAANTYKAAEQMVKASPVLNRRLKLVASSKRICRRDDSTSFYEAISSDGDNIDGCIPQMVIRDELHLWRNKKSRTLFTVLDKSARTKRKNPLVIDITTAGEMDKSDICWGRHQHTLEWLAGNVEKSVARRFYGRVFCADQKRMDEEPLYWTTREARVLANPAHEDNGGHIKDEVLADMVQKALTDSQERVEYQRYHLNYWGTSSESVIDYPRWLKCGGGLDMSRWDHYDIEHAISHWKLADNPCVLGVDLGATADLSALVAAFPPFEERAKWAFLAWYWMPRSKVEKRHFADQVPYMDWVEKGFITAHNEQRTDPLTILPQIKWCMQFFQVRELAYDPWNAPALIKRITTGDDRGEDIIDLECWEVGQNTKDLNSPTKWLISSTGAEEGLEEIMHGNNPVFNWNARNLGVKRDSNNNIKPNKVEDKNPKKIDGVAAAVTALRRGLVLAAQNQDVFVSSMA